MIITAHAAARYIERIEPNLSVMQARARISGHARAVEVAARFGCRIVRLGNGAKLVLDGDEVVTVLRPENTWSGHVNAAAKRAIEAARA